MEPKNNKNAKGNDTQDEAVRFCRDCKHAMPHSPRNYYCKERRFGVRGNREACEHFADDTRNDRVHSEPNNQRRKT